MLTLRRPQKSPAPNSYDFEGSSRPRHQNAEEGISYRIPYYDYYGPLVWFAAFKNHVGIFLRPPVIEEHKHELKSYVTTKSALHFPMDKPLPEPLIRKLVKARIAKNKAATNEKIRK